MTGKALYSGSFDPITNGHMNIIERASSLFDELVILVASNPKKQCKFTVDDRMAFLRTACRDITNIKIECYNGLIADYVIENDINIVVRGLRNSDDFDYELEMAQYNAKLFAGKAETLFMMTSAENSYISSTGVKEILSHNGDVSGLVPDSVINMMEDK